MIDHQRIISPITYDTLETQHCGAMSVTMVDMSMTFFSDGYFITPIMAAQFLSSARNEIVLMFLAGTTASDVGSIGKENNLILSATIPNGLQCFDVNFNSIINNDGTTNNQGYAGRPFQAPLASVSQLTNYGLDMGFSGLGSPCASFNNVSACSLNSIA